MTEKERLISMTGEMLIAEADKLGIKVKCNRTRTQLKEAKAGVADRILAATQTSEKPVESNAPKMMPMPGSDMDPEKGRERGRAQSVNTAKPKRGQLIEYDGRSQNICAWAKELGISANTLYGRLYRLGWPVEKAFAGGKKNE